MGVQRSFPTYFLLRLTVLLFSEVNIFCPPKKYLREPNNAKKKTGVNFLNWLDRANQGAKKNWRF